MRIQNVYKATYKIIKTRVNVSRAIVKWWVGGDMAIDYHLCGHSRPQFYSLCLTARILSKIQFWLICEFAHLEYFQINTFDYCLIRFEQMNEFESNWFKHLLENMIVADTPAYYLTKNQNVQIKSKFNAINVQLRNLCSREYWCNWCIYEQLLINWSVF